MIRKHILILGPLMALLMSMTQYSYGPEEEKGLIWYLNQYQSLDQFSLKMEYIMYDEENHQVDDKEALFIKDGTSYRFEIKGEVTIYQNDKLNIGVYHNDSIVTVSGFKESESQLPNQIVDVEQLKFFEVKRSEADHKVMFDLVAQKTLPIQQVSMTFDPRNNLATETVIRYNDKITQGSQSYKPTLKIKYLDWKMDQHYNANIRINEILKYDFKKKEGQLLDRYKKYQLIDLYKRNN